MAYTIKKIRRLKLYLMGEQSVHIQNLESGCAAKDA